MPHASYLTDHVRRNDSGGLCVDGVSISEIAEKHGTPTYIYSEASVTVAATDIIEAFRKHHKGETSIHYSLKANANFSIVKMLLKLGVGIDCVSAGEVFKAIKCGCDPSHIVYAGVGKDPASIDFAVEQGVTWFNVENEAEVDYISASATKHGKLVSICVRVNPNVKAVTNENIATGHKETKFGVPMGTAKTLFAKKASYPNVTIRGVHVHIGSQLESIVETAAAVRIAVDLCDTYGLTHVNIGGGFPISYGAPEDAAVMPSIEDFAKAISPIVEGKTLMMEPGRRIVGHSGLLVTKALYTKRAEESEKRFLVVDASMSEILRPALYGKGNPRLHAVLPAHVDATTPVETRAAAPLYSVVGPVCETTDVLGECRLAVPEETLVGSHFAVMTAGAYGFCMANTYNARPLPPQVIVRPGGTVEVSTKRSTFDDLIRDELDV